MRRRDEFDANEIIIIIVVNIDIISNSNLNNIKIILFRHQHILNTLIIIIIESKLIIRFSTSKVDIFIKLFRTFVNINDFDGINIY